MYSSLVLHALIFSSNFFQCSTCDSSCCLWQSKFLNVHHQVLRYAMLHSLTSVSFKSTTLIHKSRCQLGFPSERLWSYLHSIIDDKVFLCNVVIRKSYKLRLYVFSSKCLDKSYLGVDPPDQHFPSYFCWLVIVFTSHNPKRKRCQPKRKVGKKTIKS